MADPLTPAISDRICAHMNDDHAEAVVLYARVYGGIETETALMQAIDAEAMTSRSVARRCAFPSIIPCKTLKMPTKPSLLWCVKLASARQSPT